MWLNEVGLYHYKARVYAPHLGRFLQPDPIGYAAGMNLYAYVGNDPINLVDPLGLQACGGEHGPCPPPEPDDVVVIGSRCGGFWIGDYCADISVLQRSFNRPGAGGGRSGGPRVTFKLPPARPGFAKLSQCIRDFLASQGLSDSIVGDITFHRGSPGSETARAALALGYPAITLGSNIYVAPAAWDRGQFAPGTVGFFEEVAHAFQWSRSGNANFLLSWAGGSLAGRVLTGDAHDSPVELEAILTAQSLERANSCTQ